MSDELALDYERLRYIQLRGDGSKLPAKSWGGYSQDFDAADHVHTHEDVEIHPSDNWGIVDVESPDHASFALLIFDIDIHKAPEGFDADRVEIPTGTLVTRSQNGGFHVYFVINGCDRGELNESDFQMTADPGFDIDIRGSSVSHHVVAPADIPGVGGDYEIVNDESIAATFEPAEAARRIHLDGEPLVEFAPDDVGIDYDFEVPTEAPDDMPTCYHAGLELRKAAPDDHPNTHKVNMLTAACGLGAGYDIETVAGHFCGEYAPVDGDVDHSDKEATKYQLGQIERGGYNPPSEQTLRDYGILGEGEHCDGDCPIDYHGPDSGVSFDVLDSGDSRDEVAAAEAEAVAGEVEPAETDGGAVTAGADGDSGPETSFEAFADRVRDAITVYDAGDIKKATARQRITDALMDEFDFVYPEEEVFGWAHRLYVYEPGEGIYEPRGVDFIERQLERAGGDFVTNNLVREVVGKVERRSKKRDRAFNTAPERLVVDNGILDLHTGELDPHSALEYHRSKIDVAWNPDAGEPDAIDEFFHDIVDDSDVDTLYRLVAHALYKDYIGNKAAMLIGSGANGKSMFLSLIEELVGEFNVTRRELHDFSGDDFALNNLAGKLANLATEIGDKEMNDTTAFKKATGGDNITAQVKHESPIDFKNYATMMFATNEMPVFGQDNHAIWRRWLYVEFPYTFDDTDPDAKDPVPERVLERRLFRDEELQALLVRCQQEIERWWNGEDLFAGAMPPGDVRAKMKQAAEPVFAFANACLEAADEDEWVEKSVVREAYKSFASEEDLPRIPDNEFGSRLLSLRDYHIEAENGKRHQGDRYNVYSGVQLSSRGRQVLGVDEAGDGQGTVDGEYQQATAAVLDHIHELVDDSGGEPVPAEAIVWSVPELGKAEAASALEELKSSGRVYDSGDGVLPT